MDGVGNSSCITNLTSDQRFSALAISGLSFASFILSVVGVVLGVHEYCVKSRLSDLRTEKLLLYLTCIALVFSLLGSFQWLARLVETSPVANAGCTILGFMWFTVAIYYLAFIFCLGLHFLILLCSPKLLSVAREERIKRSKIMEKGYIVLATVIAILTTPWPFINHIYGFNLWICWIDTMRDDCSIIDIGVIETTAFYAALIAVYLFSFTVVVIVQMMIWLHKRQNMANFYVWIFLTHLVIGLTIIVIVMVINFLDQDIVPAGIRAVKILAIPALPFTMSLVTTVAVTYKKCWYNKRAAAKQTKPGIKYGSITETPNDAVINGCKEVSSSRVSTTFWRSPPTGVTTGSTTITHVE